MTKVVLFCAAVPVLAAAASGQSSAPAENHMLALVAEIKGLRADLNRVAGANIRSQLLVGRLQLQEQRTVALSRQLESVQHELANTTMKRAALEDQLRELADSTEIRPEERQEAERAFRRDLRAHQMKEQQLRHQESSLSALVAEEQARWTDFSSRLDELERALMGKRR